MKKLFTMFALAAMVIGLTGCVDDEDDGYRTYEVAVQLALPDIAQDVTAIEGVTVTAVSSVGTESTTVTDATGMALFSLPEDIYNFAASCFISADGVVYPVNYTASATITRQEQIEGHPFLVEMTPAVSQGSKQLVIKEIYTGGCQKDDGSGHYQFDKYMVVYNNSAYEARVKNFCVTNAGPYNANAGINNYVDGKLVYADAGYTPAHAYLFYLVKDFVLAPYASATVVLCGAIDHTTTYSNSVDLSHADYVCYDSEDFWNTSYHPVPSADIPTENHLLASKFCKANQNATAWSMVSPAIFIFSTGDNDPLAWSQSEENRYYFPGKEGNDIYAGTKVPNDWIIDAVDVWGADYVGTSLPRYSSVLEAGSIYMTNKQGYSIYRNVDKEATEALAENEGKLVYGYSLGTTDYQGATSTDPSTIDAEASMAAGAHIIFKDTNNSTNDFHQRAKASLKKE